MDNSSEKPRSRILLLLSVPKLLLRVVFKEDLEVRKQHNISSFGQTLAVSPCSAVHLYNKKQDIEAMSRSSRPTQHSRKAGGWVGEVRHFGLSCLNHCVNSTKSK